MAIKHVYTYVNPSITTVTTQRVEYEKFNSRFCTRKKKIFPRIAINFSVLIKFLVVVDERLSSLF